jgi:uncharacterized protein YlxP (DUF503 family)
MVVGILQITLRLPSVQSLKEKRSVLKPLLNRLRLKFNISVAEIEKQDKWQAAVVAVACVSGNSAQAHRLLEQVLDFVELEHSCMIIDSHLEIL